MKKYKVIALSVGAMSNKIFHSGDIVNETAFPPGHAEKLVADGFLEAVRESDKKEIQEQKSNTEETKIPVIQNPPPRPPSKKDKK